MAQQIKKDHRGGVFAVTRWVGSVHSIVLHTVVFIASFVAVFAGVVNFDRMLLVLTTAVSLEAIYLAIFIQLSVNQASESLEEVEQDIDEIQEDIDEIQEDVDEIQTDVDEIQEDVEEMTEEEKAEERRTSAQAATLSEIQKGLQKLAKDLENLQKGS